MVVLLFRSSNSAHTLLLKSTQCSLEHDYYGTQQLQEHKIRRMVPLQATIEEVVNQQNQQTIIDKHVHQHLQRLLKVQSIIKKQEQEASTQLAIQQQKLPFACYYDTDLHMNILENQTKLTILDLLKVKLGFDLNLSNHEESFIRNTMANMSNMASVKLVTSKDNVGNDEDNKREYKEIEKLIYALVVNEVKNGEEGGEEEQAKNQPKYKLYKQSLFPTIRIVCDKAKNNSNNNASSKCTIVLDLVNHSTCGAKQSPRAWIEIDKVHWHCLVPEKIQRLQTNMWQSYKMEQPLEHNGNQLVTICLQ